VELQRDGAEVGMNAQLIGFPTALGMPRQASCFAPDALRRGGLVRRMARHARVTDHGDVPIASPDARDRVHRRVCKVMAAAERQARMFELHQDPDALTVTIGGDHSTSLGTLMALGKRYRRGFDVVWIDAHADFNTPRTSPSGNPHGMVLAIAAGLTRYLPRMVAPPRLRLWGMRDVDPGERRLLESHGVEVRDVAATRRQWLRLLDSLADDVFVSFDCDACEPEAAPGTMTPVPDGFTAAEALGMVRQIAASRRLLALDVVEYHPDRDSADGRTASLASQVIETAVAAQRAFRTTSRVSDAPSPSGLAAPHRSGASSDPLWVSNLGAGSSESRSH
jgi:arginase